jgi:RNA polymerase sigma-70 factor (ECF subfamily)
VRENGGRLLSIARRYLRDEEDARDAVQEAFLSAHRSIASFRGQSNISTWLHRIVVNAALMKLRRRRSAVDERSIDELLPRFLEDGHAAGGPFSRWDESAEKILAGKEIAKLVREAIDRLPDSYRTVLLLRDIEELSGEEAAEALGISRNAVKIRLHRARQALRTLLSTHLAKSTIS